MPSALFLSLLASFLFVSPSLRGDALEVLNRGIGGNNSRHLLKRVDSDVLAAEPDLVVLMVGTNDMLNSGAAVPLEEYRANLRTLAEQILGAGARLVLMTIPPCDEPALFSRHPRAFFETRSPGERIADANAEVVRLAKEMGIPVVDVFQILNSIGAPGPDASSVLRNLANCGVNDGVHPTPEGYRLIATALYQEIAGMNERPKRIVCFGDSITYGHGAAGAGTSEGDTYPGFLAKLLARSDR